MEDDGSLLLWLACGGSLLLGVWFTGIWRALSTLSWGRIRKLDPHKEKDLIRRAENWLENREQYRITLLMTIFGCLLFFFTAIYLLTNKIGAPTVSFSSRFWRGLATVVFFVLITECIGSGLLAMRQWPLLSFSMPVIRVLHWIFLPVSWPSFAMQRKISHRKEEEDEEDQATTEDEIMSLVEQDEREREVEDSGGLEDNERRMIRGIFDLDETLVKEIMTPRVDLISLSATATVEEVKQKIINSGHSRIPVYTESIDDIQGIVYSKDLLDDQRLASITEIRDLAHRPIFIPETKNVGVLLEEFKQNKIHIAVVIDEYGGTAGVVTIEDILEEIVGEIRDEFDKNEEDLVCIEVAPDTLIVDGRVPIDQINELWDMAISEEEEYDTVAGFVASELGRIPAPGESIQLKNLDCLVLEGNERKINKLKLIRRDAAELEDKTA